MKENNKYISRYSNDKEVSSAQYITEIICEQKAKINKEDLHYKFWTSKKWAAFFRNQIATAHKLLKQYSAKAIIKALLSDKGQKIFSLRAPHLIAMIEQAEQELLSENTQFTKAVTRKSDIQFKTNADPKKNILSKLEDIDNDD
jgi:ribosomal protein S25